MTRRLQTQAANPLPAREPVYDGLVAMYEHEALRLMLRCLYRQFLDEENAAAVRTAATLLKSLPAARRGGKWIDLLEEINRDIAQMTPEEMDAEILEGFGVVPEAGQAGQAGQAGEAGGAEGEVESGEVVGDFRTQRQSHRHPGEGRDPDSRTGADKSGA
ncbi:hypothetical protein [Maricaulis salignorans]|uniref:hypothetical protein n=1 Tax=Maricaulis salignorans TaxID=144026 RepID=UPI003A9466E3